jgi:16S rRNA (uracil1498-N3)-methyltransferase
MPLMNRFCVPAENLSREELNLPDEIARQVARVLRLRAGDRIAVFSGDGSEVEATLVEVTSRGVRVRLGERRYPDTALRCAVRVGLAVLKGEKLDWTVQKLTELGVSEIALLNTERTISSAGEERWSRRMERYRRIAREAAEQCGAVHLPELREPVDLARFLESTDGEQPRSILDPRASLSLHARLHPPPARFTLLVGPEGGFTEREVQLATQHDVVPVSLGRRTLRAETAAVAAAAVIAQVGEAGC